MDPASEALMRSSLHDLANAMSGIRGILDLSDPLRPLSPRDRERLDAIISEGMVTLERSRYLAMASLPDALLESGTDWRHLLKEQLSQLGTLFRVAFQVSHEGDSSHDRWPGELLRGYATALTRQILPYVQGGNLGILCAADATEWRLRWTPSTGIPDSLRADHETRPRDISARWALRVGGSLGVILSMEGDTLLARIPRF